MTILNDIYYKMTFNTNLSLIQKIGNKQKQIYKFLVFKFSSVL